MRDLLIITPTRHRLASATRLAEACWHNCTALTDLVLAVDDDDHSYDGGVPAAEIVRGPRQTCGQWTNQIALERAGEYRALASLGDDHVPETGGWDSTLLAAITSVGGTGIAYGDDGIQHDRLPTAPVISSAIVTALGWMFHPAMIHYNCDNVWRELGLQTGCLVYVPEVMVRHVHLAADPALYDDVYGEAIPAVTADAATFSGYCADPGGLAADVAKIRTLRAVRAEHVMDSGQHPVHELGPQIRTSSPHGPGHERR